MLIQRWTQDYGIFTTNPEVLWLLAPRGPAHAYEQFTAIREELEKVYSGSTVTGWQGAKPFLPGDRHPVIPFTMLAIYTENPTYLAKILGLRQATPTTANVVLVRPRDTALLQTAAQGVPLPQVVADLSTMGERFPELAEQLLDSGLDDSRI